MVSSVFTVGIAIFTSVIFAHAGYAKLRGPTAYRDIMTTHLGRPVGPWLIVLVGLFEVASALMVLMPVTRQAGAMSCGVLLLFYGLLMWRQVQLGRRDLRCGCSGPAADTRVSGELVARNTVIAIPVLSLAVAGPIELSGPLALLGMGLGGFLLALYLAADQIIANRQRLSGWSS